MDIRRDLSYGERDLHRFDAYVPVDSNNKIVVWVHGGAWVSDDKSEHESLALRLANSTRSAVVIPNYRLSPRKPTPETAFEHPSHSEDILRLLHHLLTWEKSGNRDSTPQDIYLVGHSCSAHMLSSIILDTNSITPSLKPSDDLLRRIQGIILSEGIYDLDLLVLSFPRYLESYIIPGLGHKSSYAELSVARPALRSNTGHIRWFLIHSTGDNYIDMQQTNVMREHLRHLYKAASENVQVNVNALTQEHDDIFQSTYVELVSSFINAE